MQGKLIALVTAKHNGFFNTLVNELKRVGVEEAESVVFDLFAGLLCKAHGLGVDAMFAPVAERAWRLAILHTREYAALCADLGAFVHYPIDIPVTAKELEAGIVAMRLVLCDTFAIAHGDFWKAPNKRARSPDEPVQVFFKLPDGPRHTVTCSLSRTTLGEYCDYIRAETKSAPADMRLVFGGLRLTNMEATLGSLGIKPGSTIFVIQCK